MATAHSFGSQETASPRSMYLYCFQRIGRTTRLEPAPGHRPYDERLRRRQDASVQPHQCDQKILDHFHPALLISPGFNNPAFLKVVKKSFSTSTNALLAIEARATRTRSTGWPRSC